MYKFLCYNSVRTWLSGEWTTWGAGAVVRYSGGCALSCSPELLAGQIILIRATPNRSTCFAMSSNMSTTDGGHDYLDDSSRVSYARSILATIILSVILHKKYFIDFIMLTD